VLVAIAALLLPPDADAHIRTGVLAVDYRASVFRLRAPVRAAIAVKVYESDLAIALTVRGGHNVVGLGYLGEPFFRVGNPGVAVNETSPTAASVGLLKGTRTHGGTVPRWQLRSRGRTVVWHDSRLRGLPTGVRRGQWRVPLVVDGRRVRLAGELLRVEPPSPWLWLAPGVPFIAVAALVLLLGRRPWRRSALTAFAVLAAAGTIALATGFALYPNAPGGRWVEGANEVVIALAGLAVIARGSPHARSLAGGALGLLGLTVGLSKLPVLLHGVVLSLPSGSLARTAVALTIWAGAAAALFGFLALFELLESQSSLPPHEISPRP
jgi:hypothetical protein